MYLELPKKLKAFSQQANSAVANVLRPVSRKYDKREHDYPDEVNLFAALMEGMNDGSGGLDAGAGGVTPSDKNNDEIVNGGNINNVLGMIELCWGDVGFALSIPRQGLGNAAIATVANEEQLARFGHKWAAMAITEPGAGSDSAGIRTTAKKDGDYYVLNGEKIFVTAGERAEAVVVWASVDLSLGRPAIKSFVVEKGTPGMEVVRLEEKLGIKSSDTAAIVFTDCRVHKDNLLGSPEVNVEKGFAGVMQTFDNTRPLVAAMAIGLGRACLERTKEILTNAGIKFDYETPILKQQAIVAEYYKLQADWEAARLLTMQAAWMADNGIPNTVQASMAKAKAGRMSNDVSLKCIELIGSVAYQEDEMLEKWARDSKILDIFEGTQQIQLLIIARRLLEKNSQELK